MSLSVPDTPELTGYHLAGQARDWQISLCAQPESFCLAAGFGLPCQFQRRLVRREDYCLGRNLNKSEDVSSAALITELLGGVV